MITLNNSNTYKQEIQELVNINEEVYPGQNAEIISMANTMGSDIHQHVPTLIKYGQQVDRIIEMGVRFGWSTRSFLFTRPSSLLSIDKYEWGSVDQAGANPIPGNGQFYKYKELYKDVVDFDFLLADTTKIEEIDETELLFIDTFHHRDALRIELATHGNKATRFIILHDTETFGECGQADDSMTFFDTPTTNEPGTGLMYAINEFIDANQHWVIKEKYTNNNGLTVLERM